MTTFLQGLGPHVRTIAQQRADVGLTAPTIAEKMYLWEKLSVYQSDINPENGGYQPNRIMMQAHSHPARNIFVAGGVRGGKSLGTAMEVVPWVPHSNLIWLAADSYDQTRQEFEYIEEALRSLEFSNKNMISKPRVRYNPCAADTIFGCRIETRSLKDIATFASRAPDFIGLCEPGQAPPEALGKAAERLTTRRGRLWMAGTFEDIPQSWVEDVFRRWARYPNDEDGKSYAMPTWLNSRSFPGGRTDPEILKLEHSYANTTEFLLRCAGVPVASSALVIGTYWNPRKHVVAETNFMPVYNGAKMPVELAIDPGYSGGSFYTVEVVQHHGPVKHVIDEVAVQGMVHEEVINVCRSKPWWNNIAKHNGGTIDPYAGVNHIYGALSPHEVWQRVGGITLRIPPRLPVEDVVSNMAVELKDPQTGRVNIVVSPKCQRLIWEMTHWRKKRNAAGTAMEPQKVNCDAMKALGYYLSDRKYARLSSGPANQIREEEYQYT